MYELRFAPQPTDLRPRFEPKRVGSTPLTDDTAAGFDLASLRAEAGSARSGVGDAEPDSYELEERELLFDAWCAEVDAGEPPF